MSVEAEASPPAAVERRSIFRHSAWVRTTHWIWAVCLAGLLMSGLQIFNAHPALYFGAASTFDHPALSIGTSQDEKRGLTTVFGHSFDTTGVLGLSKGADGLSERAFPRWITVPADQDFATGRRWHFLFAWVLVIDGIVYLAYGLASGHFRRDLWPRLRDLAKVPSSVLNHLRLRFHESENPRDYNVLQKLSYAAIIFIVLPLVIMAGICMSPGLNSVFPWLLDAFGGRQSARTIHFFMAMLLTLFFTVHVVMVLISGVWNNIRSMITGRYVVKVERQS